MSVRSLATVVLCFTALSAQAWDQHSLIMQSIGRTTANLNRRYLYDKVAVPTLAQEKKEIHALSAELGLNEAAVPVYNERHPNQKEVVVYELLRGEMIDEPDMGMDQNLPESADPDGVRKWMGGTSGPSSQGFRHMYFGGFDYHQPIQTIQIPFRAIGDAKVRFKKILSTSDRFFKENQKFWGVRTMLWALHYLQDLHQPFHTVQIPYWRFLPFESLFKDFVAHATHAITNYHYAYEGIGRTYLQHYESSYFRDCLETDKPKISEDLSDVVEISKAEAPQMATSLYALLGPSLKSWEIDLQKNVGTIDYWHLLKTTTDESVTKLRETTCRLYQSVAQYTWGLFDRAFNYVPESSTNRGR